MNDADVTLWGKGLQAISNGDCMEEFTCIQEKFVIIINKDVIDASGIFNGGAKTLEERDAQLKRLVAAMPSLYTSIADARPSSSKYN